MTPTDIKIAALEEAAQIAESVGRQYRSAPADLTPLIVAKIRAEIVRIAEEAHA